MCYSNPVILALSPTETAAKLAAYSEALSGCYSLLGSWAADIPEVEVKIMIGAHLFHDVSAVEKLRGRIQSLCGENVSPSENWQRWRPMLVALSRTRGTLPRIRGMYLSLKAGLSAEIRTHSAGLHHVWDEPTLLILEQIVRDLDKDIAEAVRVTDQICRIFYPDTTQREIAELWEHSFQEHSDGSTIVPATPAIPARDSRGSNSWEIHRRLT